MSEHTFISYSRRDTYAFAFNMAKAAKAGDIVCLTGDLGAGKTVFAKGFAAGLGINAEVVSPTFTILAEYPLRGEESPLQRLALYHFDAYRLGEVSDASAAASALEDIGCDEYFFGGGVCLVEWADLIRRIIPPVAVWVGITRRGGEDEREIKVCGGFQGEDA